MSLGRFLFSLLLAWVAAGSALAHDPGLSSANILRSDRGVKVTLTFAWPDLGLLRSAAEGSDLGSIEPKPPAAFGPEWAPIAESFVQVATEGVVQSHPVSEFSHSPVEANDVVITLVWLDLAPAPLRIEFPVLKKLPFGHRMVLTIGEGTEPVALLRERLSVWELPPPAVSNSSTRVGAVAGPPTKARTNGSSFVLLGVEHILIGFDHLCFLLALLLVAVRLRDVVALVTTFTFAHSLTLAAAATGIVSLSPRVVEPLIAVSIVYIGIENLVLNRPPRYRLLLVFGFGLIHGLGFARVLAERLPGVTGMAVISPLLGFNVGVELGQLAVAVCLVPLIKLARMQPRLAPAFQPALSLVIASAGMIWLFQRV